MANVCLTALREAARELLTERDAKALLDEIQERAKENARQGVETINESLDKAASEIFEETAHQAMLRKRNAYINIMVEHKINKVLEQFNDKGEGLVAYTGGVQSNIAESRRSTDAMQKAQSNALAGRFQSEMRKNGVYDTFMDKTQEPELAKELFREGTSNDPKIRKLASIINDTYRIAIKKLNQAGADIRQIEGYMARQTHNPEIMAQTADNVIDRIKQRIEARTRLGSFAEARKYLREEAYQRWKNFIEPRLDPFRTFQGADPEEFLRSTYDALVSGIHLQKPTEQDDNLFAFKGPANKAKKLSAHRVLHFKDGTAWYEYNQKFGAGTVHSAVVNTIRRSGQNIGLLKMWGPNPRAMFDKISREALETSRADADFKKIKRSIRFSDHMFADISGESSMPVNNMLAKIGSSIRAVITMAKLGNVALSSLPDLNLRASLMRSHGEGLLDSYAGALKSLVEGRPKGEMQQLTDSLGTWAESEFGHMAAYFSAADSPAGFMTKSIQLFFKLTGMEWWDHIHRTSIGTTLSRVLALQKEIPFEKLEMEKQRALDIYGIGAKEWDLIRENPIKLFNGKHYITPDAAREYSEESIGRYLGKASGDLKPYEIRDVREDIEDRLQTYFIDQVDHANIQPMAGERQTVLRGTKPGTVEGELLRFIAQFKYFSIGYIRRVVGRELYGYGAKNLAEALSGKGDIGGLVHLIVGSTILGYVSMSAKDLSKGMLPRDPSNPHTWLAAMLQGGGAGIYGDYLFGEYNRFGQSLGSTIAGPALGTMNDVATLFAKLRDGQDTTNASFNLIKNNMPFINLFYTRLGLDYLILHRIQEQVRPGSLERAQRTVEQQNNQKFWLPPSNYYGK